MKNLILSLMLVNAIVAYGQNEFTDSIQMHELTEVTIQGEKPQISAHDGILSVDLPAIVKDKPVSNILEALSYVPGVIDNNGLLALNGASSVTIILNGEVTNLPIQNLYQLLYSTPIDRLKTVEVMYAAPTKYHVNGAVLNIVLKTPRAIDGLMGQLRTSYTYKHYSSYFGGLSATYSFKDWIFDVNWSMTKDKTWNRQETYSNHLLDGKRIMIEDDMRQIGKSLTNNLYTSITYKNMKLTYYGQYNSDSHNKSVANGTFGQYINRYSYLSQPTYHNIALRYEAPFGLSLGGDFTSYLESRNQIMTKVGEDMLNANNSQDIAKYRVYADQEHQLGKWQINYGVEYQHSNDHSLQNYIFPQIEGFDDILKEDVADVYIGVQASFDWGLSFNASAKEEYFHNDYQHNWNFVPQLGATYYKTPKSIFQLTLTSQRVYPQYWELHGATSHINEYSSILGNPFLLPYLNYSSQLSYILNQKYAATLYLLYSDKYSVQLPYQKPDDLQLLFQTVNLDFSRTIGLQMQAPFEVGNILNSVAVANVMHNQERCSKFHDISFDNKRWSFYGSLNNTIRFSTTCPISLSLDASFVTGQIQGTGKFNPLWKIDAGAKWKFGKKRCCELDLKCNDILNTWNPKLTIKASGQDYQMKVHDMTQSLSLSFIWRFNGFKPHDTDVVDTSRFGTVK
ncbi:MAG: outer membrane beta-barrel protein [Muribaculaceae bacterium]|nr:outer membrane beta-barrel protein [Muribaculaceae bacterium]